MHLYRVTFERLGRTHNVPDVFLGAADADDLAEQVDAYARKYLGSRDIEAYVDLEEMTGYVTAGIWPAGRYTIADVSALPRAELVWARDEHGWATTHAGHTWHLIKRATRYGARVGGWHLTPGPALSGSWVGTQVENAKAVAPLIVADLAERLNR